MAYMCVGDPFRKWEKINDEEEREKVRKKKIGIPTEAQKAIVNA